MSSAAKNATAALKAAEESAEVMKRAEAAGRAVDEGMGAVLAAGLTPVAERDFETASGFAKAIIKEEEAEDGGGDRVAYVVVKSATEEALSRIVDLGATVAIVTKMANRAIESGDWDLQRKASAAGAALAVNASNVAKETAGKMEKIPSGEMNS